MLKIKKLEQFSRAMEEERKLGKGLEKIKNRVLRRDKVSFRVVMLGASGVGKTALIIRCLTNQFFNNYVPGKETAYRFTVPWGGNKVLLDIMDSNGKNNATICYADAVVLVYSVTDKSSYEHVKTLIKQVRYLNINNIPLVVIANKIDQTKRRIVSRYDGELLSREFDVTYFERSAAIPTDDVKSVFVELCKLIYDEKRERRDSDPSIMNPSRRMALKTVKRRMSASLDSYDFIKLVL